MYLIREEPVQEKLDALKARGWGLSGHERYRNTKT